VSELCQTVRLSSRPGRVAKKKRRSLPCLVVEEDSFDEVSLKSCDPIRMEMLSTRRCWESCREDLGARWKCVHYAVWDSWFIERMCHSVNVHCIFDGGKSSVCRTWRLKVAKYYTEEFEGFALDGLIPWLWGKKSYMPGVGDQKAFDTYSPSQPCCITQ